MKKSALLLLAGGLLTFAACTNEQAPAGGFTQEQVDSAVNARVAELQASMQASNDSAINALAQWKADSMIAAAKGQAPATTKPSTGKTNPPKTTTPATPTAPAGPEKGSVKDRPGSKNTNEPQTANDRPGAANSNEPKKANDRPGAK